MACPGSAHLELAIPGYVEPDRDDAAGAKGVGTEIHAALEPLAHYSTPDLGKLHRLVHAYAELPYTQRRLLAASRSECDAWVNSGVIVMIGSETEKQFHEFLVSIAALKLPPRTLRYLGDVIVYIWALFVKHGMTRRVYTELRMTATWLPSQPTTTADLVVVSDAGIDVVDYKTGTIFVSVDDNDQMNFYGWTALLKLDPEQLYYEVGLHILQPGNLTGTTVSVRNLRKWAEQALAADDAIAAKDLRLIPGDHCTFCPANPHSRGDKSVVKCPAKMSQLYPALIDEGEILGV